MFVPPNPSKRDSPSWVCAKAWIIRWLSIALVITIFFWSMGTVDGNPLSSVFLILHWVFPSLIYHPFITGVPLLRKVFIAMLQFEGTICFYLNSSERGKWRNNIFLYNTHNHPFAPHVYQGARLSVLCQQCRTKTANRAAFMPLNLTQCLQISPKIICFLYMDVF